MDSNTVEVLCDYFQKNVGDLFEVREPEDIPKRQSRKRQTAESEVQDMAKLQVEDAAYQFLNPEQVQKTLNYIFALVARSFGGKGVDSLGSDPYYCASNLIEQA